jgi:UDPglucose--hexose-1-phosphate uridylyltransferase
LALALRTGTGEVNVAELRQDPVTRDWVIINPERARRPGDEEAGGERCPFCPGNEDLTPSAVDVMSDESGRWSVRAVPNRYPALGGTAGDVGQRQVEAGWRVMPGYGHHEVIVETPDHDSGLGTMPVSQVRAVLEMYVRRYRALARVDGRVRQVVLFRNHGRRAGTSLAHPHAQIVATPVVAPETRWRLAEEIGFFDATGKCGLCHVLERELEAGQRIVYASKQFVTLAPFASRVPWHLQIVPREHCPSFLEADAAALDDLAPHLRAVLGALRRRLGDPHYNLVVVTPPLDEVHRHANHWFIEIVPRLTTPAGFELGSRIVINIQTPEAVATELRAGL